MLRNSRLRERDDSGDEFVLFLTKEPGPGRESGYPTGWEPGEIVNSIATVCNFFQQKKRTVRKGVETGSTSYGKQEVKNPCHPPPPPPPPPPAGLVGPDGRVIGFDPNKGPIQLVRQSQRQIQNLSFVNQSASNFLSIGWKSYHINFSKKIIP